ncbi:MAG TPA: nitrile hydratase subunit beta [Alphaproteobacteria bacterium]|jgi:nitrile hydratase|nr:nitrile hydratase subunit beta [Alphaproteobacteria bacterium]HJN59828.1 nitrile hydratase subunit beta [Alphaproteobacteria bacterium]
MPALTADAAVATLMAGASARIDVEVAAKFKAGDEVIARNINPAGHTRLPRYVRGKRGTIDKDHGVFGLPDSMAHGGGDAPQHVYSVRFSAREVWGAEASPRDCFYVDMWDDYLDPA